MIDGQRLATMRNERLLTQRELANLTGLTIQTISSIETGRTENPALETVVRLAEALRVPVQALFAPEDSSGAVESSSASAARTAPTGRSDAPQADIEGTVERPEADETTEVGS